MAAQLAMLAAVLAAALDVAAARCSAGEALQLPHG